MSIRGRAPVRFSFTVARLGRTQPPLNLTSTQPSKLNHFVTEPELTPPLIDVNHNSDRARDDGEILLTPLPSPVVHPESDNTVTIKPVGPGGPMIVDGRGRLVWFDQLAPPEVAANLRAQRYRGHQVLTWWQGTVTPSAFGVGEGVIANHSYRTIATVRTGNGYPTDLHEFELTRGGDALFTIYSPVLVHLPGTPEGTLSPLLDAIVQQVDVRTGLVVWEWHSYGHIPLSDSHATPANSASYDAYHINSVQALDANKVLISARDTSALYKVDRPSGRVVWVLGGRSSDFKLGRGARFHFQHDARMLPGRRISVFDDEAGPPQLAPSSRGLVLQLSGHPRRATVARQYHRQADTSAQSEGSVQTLADGDVFVGWGAQPFFSQFSARGRLLFDAQPPRGRRLVPRLPGAVERDAEDAADRGRESHRRVERLGLRELERRHRDRPLAGARRRLTAVARAARLDPQARLRDPVRPRDPGDHVRGQGARRGRADAGDLGAGVGAVTPPVSRR